MNFWLVLLVFAAIAFNLYAADTSYRLRDDMRVMKARTGKILELLDAVLDGLGGDAAKAAASVRARSRPGQDGEEAAIGADKTSTIDDSVIDNILAQVSKLAPLNKKPLKPEPSADSGPPLEEAR